MTKNEKGNIYEVKMAMTVSPSIRVLAKDDDEAFAIALECFESILSKINLVPKVQSFETHLVERK